MFSESVFEWMRGVSRRRGAGISKHLFKFNVFKRSTVVVEIEIS